MNLTDMNLDQQLQALIDGAPQDGSTPQLVEYVGPVLKAIAQQLKHLQYYVVQTLDQSWLMLTLIDPNQASDPSLVSAEKNIIHAFSTLKDVSASPYDVSDANLIVLPVPVIHILFQMLAMEKNHSTVFFESPGNIEVGTEIQRAELEESIQSFWQERVDAVREPTIPSDIA